MKFKLLFAGVALSSVASLSAFTVAVTNVSSPDATAVPVFDNNNELIAVGAGYVAVGTFSESPTIENLASTFTAFGTPVAFNNGVGLPGFFDSSFTEPIPEGSLAAPVGENNFIVLANGPTLADSTSFAVLSLNSQFTTDDAFGNGGFTDAITSSNLGSALVIGRNGGEASEGLPLTFTSSIVLAAVPEPSAVLLAGLALVGGLVRRRR